MPLLHYCSLGNIIRELIYNNINNMNIFGLGTPEIILILVLVLLFFGKDKLPELAKSIGRSFNALKEGFHKGEDEESKSSENKKRESKK
jgi:TatA/E family protein of Tat protein translocase